MSQTTRGVKASAGLPQMSRASISPGTSYTESRQLENPARQFSHLQVFTNSYKTLSEHTPHDKVGHHRSTFLQCLNFSCSPQKPRYLCRDVGAMFLLSGSSLLPGRADLLQTSLSIQTSTFQVATAVAGEKEVEIVYFSALGL